MIQDDEYESFLDNVSDITKFETLFTNETDRGCALLAASILDFELSILLQKSFVSNNKVNKKILSISGPLGTFSSRIDICYALGHFSKEDYNKMHTIREIRNKFGHSMEALNFDIPSISQQIKSIAITRPSSTGTYREIFIDTINKLLIQTHVASLLVTQPFEPEHFDINPKEYIEKMKKERLFKKQENSD
jgi:DNA-binding MltR family transcriptional regulator